MLNRKSLGAFGQTLLLLVVAMAVIFARSFTRDDVLFSNDAPLGAISASSANIHTAWRGVWQDLNWLGIENPAAVPDTAVTVWYALGNSPVRFSKFHVPIALTALGLSLWLLLRQFGFRHSICALAALAAALNMNIFSHACWGLPSRAWTLASVFVALAALRSGMDRRPVLKAIIAGWAVGNSIMEGFDVGAIFSLYVAAFALFLFLAQPNTTWAGKVLRGLRQVAIVAVFAALCAAAALVTLVGTQVKGVSGMQQDVESKRQRWDGATMWSLPKVETFRVLVPGLFGYRMDATGGANYWGAVGQTPGNPQTRHSGAGEYAGIFVVVVAAFAVANAFRRQNSPFTDLERRCVYFFGIAAFISVLFAWGRHAPFYQLIYALPFFSTIRNPIKFMHPFHMALLILFGFGLEALFRLYAKESELKAQNLIVAIKAWHKSAPAFERRWIFGVVGFGAAALMGALIYISSRPELIKHLSSAGFPPQLADEIARFSYAEVGLALVHIIVAIVLLASILSGWFSGRRTRILVGVIAALLLIDLIPANKPWVVYYNYKDRYASNPIIDFLRENAHEQRVTARVAPFIGNNLIDPSTTIFGSIANTWLQHHFQYYDIQSLEPVQMPRPPEIDQQYFMSMLPDANRPVTVLTRMWELSNTRYILGSKQALISIPLEIDGGRERIQIVKTFDMAPKPGVTSVQTLDDVDWVLNENGRFALAEFTGALPRAKLYPNWRKATDDTAVLNEITSASFDPNTIAFLHGETELTPSASTNFTGDVKITSYAPKQIEVTVSNSAPALLLYNDKYSPNWRVSINGQPATLHRANFIMRGIPLPAGQHRLLMTYSQPMTGLFVSLGSLLVVFAVLAFVLFFPVAGQQNAGHGSVEFK